MTSKGPTVETGAGQVSGQVKAGIRQWFGVPYAKVQRFSAPQPVEPWQGARDATAHARQCPQMFGTKIRKQFIDSDTYGEECLALNVYAPDRPASADELATGRPVYVFIHGGAFLGGSSNPYDGSWLADLGDVVVVTINYRVGVLGFVNFGDALGLPDIPSNIGLRDQIAALEWVRDNIAAFGGDPARVTIGGQSAGSMSVSLLMQSPKARGLFHGAVLQSGAVSLIHDRETSVANARAYADVLGLDQSSLNEMREMDLVRLFEAQAEVQSGIVDGIAAAPWYDSDVLPESLEEARKHDVAQVPILAGATREETRLFEWLGKGILPMERKALSQILVTQLGDDAAQRILAEYPDSKDGARQLASDLAFMMPTRNFAHRHAASLPTWFYRFDYRHPLVGAAHAIDLTVSWPFSGLKMAIARGGPNSGKRRALGERMNRQLAHFVRHGEPLADWPRYDPAAPKAKVFDLADRVEEQPDAARFAAWAGADAPARMGA